MHLSIFVISSKSDVIIFFTKHLDIDITTISQLIIGTTISTVGFFDK